MNTQKMFWIYIYNIYIYIYNYTHTEQLYKKILIIHHLYIGLEKRRRKRSRLCPSDWALQLQPGKGQECQGTAAPLLVAAVFSWGKRWENHGKIMDGDII